MYTPRSFFYLILIIFPLLPYRLSSAQAKDVCHSLPYSAVLFLANYPPAQAFCKANYPVVAKRGVIRGAARRRDDTSITTTTKAIATSVNSKTANAKTTPTTEACDSNCQAWKAYRASGQDALKTFCSCIQSPPKTTTKQTTTTKTAPTTLQTTTSPKVATTPATTAVTTTSSAATPKCTRQQHIGADPLSCYYNVCDDSQYLGVPFETHTSYDARACASQGARYADAIDFNAVTMICRLFHGANEANIVPAPGFVAGTFGGCPEDQV